MSQPFIPFPIFPPYVYWRSDQFYAFPTNASVDNRLAQLDPKTKPFINVLYANKYLNWVAHNWSAANPYDQYKKCIRGLEIMLNWSFAYDLSIIDCRREEFESYAEFVANPPETWRMKSKVARFLQQAGVGFEEWSINPAWRPFSASRSICDNGEVPMTARNEIRYAAQFLDFYLKDSLSTSENVAAHLLPSLTSKHHKATEFLTDSELEWVLNSLTNILAVHEVRIVEMYFIMARYTGRKLWSIIGNFSAPGHLDQFNRRSDGRWLELRSAKDGWQPLSPHFDEVFDRYLRYLNIDPLHPLPPTPIFPRDDTSFFNPITLSRLIISIRGILAEDAARSDDPEISSASEKFRGLTAKLVSGKPASK